MRNIYHTPEWWNGYHFIPAPLVTTVDLDHECMSTYTDNITVVGLNRKSTVYCFNYAWNAHTLGQYRIAVSFCNCLTKLDRLAGTVTALACYTSITQTGVYVWLDGARSHFNSWMPGAIARYSSNASYDINYSSKGGIHVDNVHVYPYQKIHLRIRMFYNIIPSLQVHTIICMNTVVIIVIIELINI